MSRSKKSKSKKPKPIVALIIIILLICILTYPYISGTDSESPLHEHSVIFMDGNSEYASVSITSGGTISDSFPKNPEFKDEYVFTGWNTKSDGSGTKITADTKIQSDLTVYAVWIEKGEMSGNGYLSTAEQSYKISENIVEIVLEDLNPSPEINSVTVSVYDPNYEAKYEGTFNGSEYTLSLGTVNLEYYDTDLDGIMESGEKLIIKSDEGFCTGIWNIEIRYEEYTSGNVDFRFHIFEGDVEKYEENVRITFLDVGQADSALIMTSDNKTILIDAGVPLYKKSEYVPILLKQLEDAGVEKIDAMILTHPDYDHIAGAEAVLEKYDVYSVYTCATKSTSETYKKLMSAIDAEGCKKRIGDFKAGDYLNLSATESFRVLAVDEYVSNDKSNAASVVLRMSCESTSVLFTGDIPSEVEKTIISEYPLESDVDILKVAHHGSGGSNCEEFLQAATPVVSVISCGEGNSYGHPHEEALDRLEVYSATIIRTDVDGSWTHISYGGIIE